MLLMQIEKNCLLSIDFGMLVFEQLSGASPQHRRSVKPQDTCRCLLLFCFKNKSNPAIFTQAHNPIKSICTHDLIPKASSSSSPPVPPKVSAHRHILWLTAVALPVCIGSAPSQAIQER